MKIIFTILNLTFLLSVTKAEKPPMPKPTSIYDYSFMSIDGKEIKMSQFKGKKILIVNTASECGYTPQYKELQELHQKYGDKVVLIGFPTNDFGKQEPGSNTEIKTFCQTKFGVTFLMAEKITVKGEEEHPIYKWLTQKVLNGKMDSKVEWNFNKYLISENGELIDCFKSKVKPDDEKIVGLLK